MIMKIIKYVIITFVLITGYQSLSEASETPRTEPYLFLAGVNIVQMKTGEVLENYYVVIRNGKIESMVEDDLKGTFKGELELVDAEEKYLLGGTFNAGDEKEFKPLNIKEGMSADFLILDSNPLDGDDEYDIFAIIKNGKFFKMK